MEMHPYWLTIKNPPQFSTVSLGIGITAYSEDDAKKIFSGAFGDDLHVADVRLVHSVDEIEQAHVRPNMGDLLVRGVWFPRGFEGSP
jgi:hypothetical protein